MSNCNKQKPCGCKEASKCGCDIKLDLLCAFYSGVDLQPLGITAGMDGNTVIKIINDYIKNVLEEIDLDPTIIESIGNGAEVYKGLSNEYRHQIKSLIAGEGIIITEQDDTVTLSVDPTLVRNVGTGAKIYKGLSQDSKHEIKSLIQGSGIIISQQTDTISLSVDPSIIPTPENPFSGENIGTGVAVYDNTSTVIQKFRRIGSQDNSITPTIAQDGGIDLKANLPVIDGKSIGSGTPIYKDSLNEKKIGIASLSTNNLKMSVKEDGTIIIDGLESGSSSSNSYFVDEAFVPSVDFPSDGSRSRPFTTLTAAVMARLGGEDTLAKRLNPTGSKNTIVLLSDVTDSIDPTINNTWFKLEGVSYLYTGNNTYIFDLKKLYDQTKIPNGSMQQDIYFVIQGSGSISRSTGFGHCRNINDDTYPGAVGSDPMSSLKIVPEGTGLEFSENRNYSVYTELTKKDGTPLILGAGVVYGANIQPSIPMFSMIGGAKQYWATEISGTSLRINTMSQVGIRLENGAGFYDKSTVDLIVDQDSKYVGYEFRDVSGTEVLYTPYNTRNLIEITNGSVLQTDLFSFRLDSPNYTKVNSIFKLVGSTDITKRTVLSIPGELKPMSNKGAINFIEYSGTTNIVQLNKAKIVGRYTNFVKGDNVNSLELVFQESVINNVETRFLNAMSTSNFSTGGTVSTIKGTSYITGLQNFSDNNEAITALGRNALYTITTGGNASIHITI